MAADTHRGLARLPAEPAEQCDESHRPEHHRLAGVVSLATSVLIIVSFSLVVSLGYVHEEHSKGRTGEGAKRRQLYRRSSPLEDPHKPALQCAMLNFNWTDANPYDNHKAATAVAALTFYPRCPETQRCLFARDDTISNIIL
eukprot:37144-Prymnesium_polylepis.1